MKTVQRTFLIGIYLHHLLRKPQNGPFSMLTFLWFAGIDI